MPSQLQSINAERTPKSACSLFVLLSFCLSGSYTFGFYSKMAKNNLHDELFPLPGLRLKVFRKQKGWPDTYKDMPLDMPVVICYLCKSLPSDLDPHCSTIGQK
jgi:hypothetical protein